MRLAITVTRDHIARGVPDDGNHCPIALACREASGMDDVAVDAAYLSFGPNAAGIEPGCYRPTEEIRDFIEAFDAGEDAVRGWVVPVTFLLELERFVPGVDPEGLPGEVALATTIVIEELP